MGKSMCFLNGNNTNPFTMPFRKPLVIINQVVGGEFYEKYKN